MLSAVNNKLTTLEESYGNKIGYFYSLIGHICFIFSSNFIKKSTSGASSSQVLFYLRFWPIFINYYMVVKNKYPFAFKSPQTTTTILLRGFCGLAGGAFLVKGLSMLPLAEAIVIINMTPPIGGIIATLALKEPFTKMLVITSILSTIGVLFIAKPGYLFPANLEQDELYPNKTLGIICIILADIFAGCVASLVRSLKGSIPMPSIMLYFGLSTCLISPMWMIQENVTSMETTSFFIIALASMCNNLAHTLNGKALKFIGASKASTLFYSQIVYGYLLDIFVNGQELDKYSTIGAGFIFSCLFVNIYFGIKTKNQQVKLELEMEKPSAIEQK